MNYYNTRMRKYKSSSIIPINKTCNQKCIFCSAEWENRDFSMKHLIKQATELDDYVQISWWEPILDKNIFKILATIRKLKPSIFIEFQSNWVHLFDNNNLKKLLKFWINLLNINYPCHVESINDIIVWCKWTLIPREKAIREIIKQWWNLRLTIIIIKDNYKYLEKIIQHISENFVWLERVQLSFVKILWSTNKNLGIIPKYEDVETNIISALMQWEKSNIIIDVDHIPMCYLWEFYECHVDYNKIKQWIPWPYQTEKWVYLTKCKECEFRTKCSWYRKDYLKVYPQKNEL